MTATTVGVPRVLVISAEPVGARMAGPAIRALELARALAESCTVTLAAPAPSDLAGPERAHRAAARPGSRTTARCWRRSGRTTSSSPSCCRRACSPGSGAGRSGSWSTSTTRPSSRCWRPPAARHPARGRGCGAIAARAAAAHLAAADLVLCASERQRDLWLGGLGLAGELPATRDPVAARLPRRGALRRPGRAAGPGRRAGPARGRARHRAEGRACCCGAAASGTGSTPRRRSARPPGSRTARPPCTSSSRASAGPALAARDEHPATARAMTLARGARARGPPRPLQPGLDPLRRARALAAGGRPRPLLPPDHLEARFALPHPGRRLPVGGAARARHHRRRARRARRRRRAPAAPSRPGDDAALAAAAAELLDDDLARRRCRSGRRGARRRRCAGTASSRRSPRSATPAPSARSRRRAAAG